VNASASCSGRAGPIGSTTRFVESARRAVRADYLVMDVTSETSVQHLVQHARDAFGRLDIMICNAGFGFLRHRRRDARLHHAAHDGCELHGTFYARARRCRSSARSRTAT